MYIITGGAGFIGSVIVRQLNDQGVSDIIVVDQLGKSEKWKNLLGKRFHEYLHKDQLLAMLEAGRYQGQISGIIHMGACSATTEEDGDYLMLNNVEYSKRLLHYALQNDIRFIYASSAAIYGDGSLGFSDSPEATAQYRPLNRYGYSKQLFDDWCIRLGVTDRVVGLRFFNVYGPNEAHKGAMQSVVFKAYHQLVSSGEITLFRSYREDYADGEQKRDFIYVKDCAELVWWFLNNPKASGIFNLGTGRARSWNDLANSIGRALERDPKVRYVEMPANLVKQYQYFTEADIASLRATGVPLPRFSLEEGVRDYVSRYLVSGGYC